MQKKYIGIAAILIIAAGLAAFFIVEGGAEHPSDNPMEQAIKDRQAKFKKMGSILKNMDEQIKSGAPDQKKISEMAGNLVALATGIPNWFPVGSGPESGFDTKAKPEIWSDNDGFLKQYQAFTIEAKKLADIATSDNMADLTAQYYTTGVACANCHKPFRVKRD
jgi:cytochrome c556